MFLILDLVFTLILTKDKYAGNFIKDEILVA